MKKITDLQVERFRTTHNKDRYGNRIRGREIYLAKRSVKTVSGIQRFGHFFLDYLIIQVLLVPIQIGLSMLATQSDPFSNFRIVMENASPIIGILILPAYYVITENMWGKSIGKFATQTRVIDEYGNKPQLNKIISRSFLRLIPFEAFSCMGENSRGWHDKWSDTYVVTEKEFKQIQKLLNEQDEDNLVDHLI